MTTTLSQDLRFLLFGAAWAAGRPMNFPLGDYNHFRQAQRNFDNAEDPRLVQIEQEEDEEELGNNGEPIKEYPEDDPRIPR
jgi:hypothetical protein